MRHLVLLKAQRLRGQLRDPPQSCLVRVCSASFLASLSL